MAFFDSFSIFIFKDLARLGTFFSGTSFKWLYWETFVSEGNFAFGKQNVLKRYYDQKIKYFFLCMSTKY